MRSRWLVLFFLLLFPGVHVVGLLFGFLFFPGQLGGDNIFEGLFWVSQALKKKVFVYYGSILLIL